MEVPRFKKKLEANFDSKDILDQGTPNVIYGLMDVPNAFAQSQEAKGSGQSVEVSQAMSLARFYQCPVAETLRLWDSKPEDNLILEMQFSKYQKSLSEYSLIQGLHHTAIQCVNEIGIDLQATADNEEHHNLF